MGNNSSTNTTTIAEKLSEKVQQVKEGTKDEITKRKISFLRKFDLPSTQLTNEQVQQMKYTSDYKLIGFPLQELLYRHYERDQLRLNLRAEDNLLVCAKFDGYWDKSLRGKAIALYNDSQSFSAQGSLETKNQLEAEMKARYYDPKLQGAYLLGHLKTNSMKWNQDDPNSMNLRLGGGWSSRMLSGEVLLGTDKSVRGFLMARLGKLIVGGQAIFAADETKDDLELIASYQNKLDSVPPGQADFFELTLKGNPQQNTLSAGYFQHMTFPSKTTGYNHHLSLGGEFQHRENDLTNPNVLIAGGQWQLADGSVLRAKGDTTGQMSVALSWKLFQRPDTIVVLNSSMNMLKLNDHKIGFGLSVTG